MGWNINIGTSPVFGDTSREQGGQTNSPDYEDLWASEEENTPSPSSVTGIDVGLLFTAFPHNYEDPWADEEGEAVWD